MQDLLLLRGVVRLDGLGLDDDGCVTALVILTLRRNRPRHVARTQSDESDD